MAIIVHYQGTTPLPTTIPVTSNGVAYALNSSNGVTGVAAMLSANGVDQWGTWRTCAVVGDGTSGQIQVPWQTSDFAASGSYVLYVRIYYGVNDEILPPDVVQIPARTVNNAPPQSLPPTPPPDVTFRNLTVTGTTTGITSTPAAGSVVDASVATGAAIAPTKIAGTAIITSDGRLSDARTPTAHAGTHGAAGSDPLSGLTAAQIASVNPSALTGTGTVPVAGLPAATPTTRGAVVVREINVKDPAYGALGDGVTDDTAAIMAAITAAGTRGIVYFPAGVYVAHDLVVPSGVRPKGAGYEISQLLLKPGYSTLLKTANFDSLTGTGSVGSSPFNNGLIGLTIDGNKAAQTLWTSPPATLTVGQAGTPGSTTRYYSVSTVVTRPDGTTGETEGSIVTSTTTANATLDGTNFDTLSWSAASLASGHTLVGYHVYDGAARVRLTASPVAGTTYNVQSAAAASGVHPLPNYNTTPGVLVQWYGYGWIMTDLRIRNGAGLGLWTEWANQGSSPGNDSMEAFFTDSKVHDCAGGGWVHMGPHDAQAHNIEVIACGTNGHRHAALSFPIDGGYANGTMLQQCHVWGGTYDYPVYVGSSGVRLAQSQFEGGRVGQLWINASINSADGLHLFSGGINPTTAVGFTLGSPGKGINNIRMAGVKVEQCGGGVYDVTHAGNLDLNVNGQFYGGAATPAPVVLGSYDSNSRIDTVVTDTGGFIVYSVAIRPGTIDATNIVTYLLRANQSATRQETCPRLFLNAASTISNGFVYCAYFTPDANLTVSNLLSACRGTAAVGATLAKLGLYTVDGSNNLTCVARSANCASANANIVNGTSNVGLWTTANKLYTTPIVDNGAASPSAISTYALVKGQRYALAMIVVGTTTAPQLDAANMGVNDVAFQSPIVATVSGGSQTDLAAAYTAGSVSGNGALFYGALT